jgi:hypothetical protein
MIYPDRNPRFHPILTLVLIVLASPTSGARGDASEERFENFRVRALGQTFYQSEIANALERPLGLEIGLEYSLRPSFGLELAIGRVHFRTDRRSASSGIFAMHPITLATVFRRPISESTAIFIAPQFGWAIYSGGHGMLGRRHDEHIFGGKMGFDVRGGQRWLWGLEVRRMRAEHFFRDHPQFYRPIDVTLVALVFSYSARNRPTDDAQEDVSMTVGPGPLSTE